MRNICLVCLSLLLVTACKKSCPIPELTVTGDDNGNVSLTWTPGRGYAYWQIEYGTHGFSHGSGTMQIVTGFTNLTLSAGSYDFYVRTLCEGQQWSDWSEVKSYQLTCDLPTSLSVVDNTTTGAYEFNWQHVGADSYEVEYGVNGFSIGQGTRISTTNMYYTDGSFAQNTTYQFYVRAYCGTRGWSDWSGPQTFLSTRNYHRCLAPFNVSGSAATSSSVTFTWNRNGETSWESIVVDVGTQPTGHTGNTTSTNSVTYSLPHGHSYDFYVRAICTNGNRTAWAMPVTWTW